MQRIVQAAITALLPVLIAGCNAIAGIHDGDPYAGVLCATLADCASSVEVPECRTAVACTKGRCVFEDAAEGTRLQAQTPGDCAEVVCNGAGRSMQVPVPFDAEDDGNPCTRDRCKETHTVHELLDWGYCYSGPEGTEGKGICAAGVQQCDTQGNPVGPCEGEVLPMEENCVSPLDDDCDGAANEEGYGCICQPGVIEPCYTGPAATEGVGICHGGQHACGADGHSYDPCFGEQPPLVETCDAAMLDEDCDGQTNEEGADCVCGDGFVSVGETCDDGNLDSNDACNASCQPPGCGDGYVQPGLGEECDDGNPTEACNASCLLWKCGNGILESWESCDDGNNKDGDACPAGCLRAVVKLDVGSHHACVLLDDSRVNCWGTNNYGQLGQGDTEVRGDTPAELQDYLPGIDLGVGEIAVDLFAGGWVSCALLQDGGVKCWGYNYFGQLGLGDKFSRGDIPILMGDNLPVIDLGTGKAAIAIASDVPRSCALLADGTVKCWGYNDGLLGIGDFADRGDAPGEMGDSLPAVNLGAGKTAVALAAGRTHTCALLSGGSVKCWGYNPEGELGLGDTLSRGDSPNHMGDNLPTVNLGAGKTAVAISGGDSHTCALLNDGSIKCWGNNQFGELGLGDIKRRGDNPGEMGNNLPAVDLGTGKTAIAISTGDFHTCALLSDHRVKCWGYSPVGGLGLGDILARGDNPGEMGNNLPAVDLGTGKTAIALGTGAGHTCALLSDHRVKCWGWNESGQLGLGDTSPRGINPGEMGDSLPIVPP